MIINPFWRYNPHQHPAVAAPYQLVTPYYTLPSTRETVSWQPPHHGWIKINSDASVKSQTAGAGGLGRDHNGDIVFALAHPIKTLSVVEAEAKALLLCLSHALKLGCRQIWLESDSKLVVDAVNDWPLKPIYSYCNHIIEEIVRLLATSVDQWVCSHIYREGNGAADYLARLGHSGVPQIWEDGQEIPNELGLRAFRDVFEY